MFSLGFGPATLEVKGKCANHFATEAPWLIGMNENEKMIMKIYIQF
jgi:hypothetical protein